MVRSMGREAPRLVSVGSCTIFRSLLLLESCVIFEVIYYFWCLVAFLGLVSYLGVLYNFFSLMFLHPLFFHLLVDWSYFIGRRSLFSGIQGPDPGKIWMPEANGRGQG